MESIIKNRVRNVKRRIERIPDPTTASDFCRRFAEPDIRALMAAIDDARLNVWARQPKKFFDQATGAKSIRPRSIVSCGWSSQRS